MGECPHDSLAPGGWRGGGRGVCPPPDAQGPRPSGRPPAATGEQHQGTGGGQRGAPFLPPSHLSPPQLTDSWRPARETAAPHPPPRGARGRPPPPPERAAAPREGRRWARSPHAPSQPPAHSHSTRGRPAALRRRARAPRGPHAGSGTRTRAGAVWGALMPAPGGQRHRPRQSDRPPPAPRGPPAEPPTRGGALTGPRPPRPDRPTSGRPDGARRPGLPNSPGRARGRGGRAAPCRRP